MSRAAYSNMKAVWHVKDIMRLRLGQQIVPHQLHFIISDLCNHDCNFCAYRSSQGFTSEQFGEDTGKGFTMNPNRMIPTEKCREILDDCLALGIKAIQFTGGGEPTVHKDHIKIIEYAQVLGLETALVTNGYLLRDGWERVFPKLSWMRVSVDAGQAKTYAKIRGVNEAAFNKTLSNLYVVAHEMSEADSKCLLGAGFVITEDNWTEIAQACRLIKEAGAAYVRLSGLFQKNMADYYDGEAHLEDRIKDAIIDARLTYEDEDFKVVDLFADRFKDLEQGRPDYEFCGYQQFCTYIGANLKVYRCCTTSYTRHGEIGDLSDQSLGTWFVSDAKRKAIEHFDARDCQVCQFNNKNRAINYVVGEKPLHVEWV